jgi:flagellar FliJ protein
VLYGWVCFQAPEGVGHRSRIEENKKQVFAKSRIQYLGEKQKLDILNDRLKEFSSREGKKNTSALSYVAAYNYTTLMEERIEDQEKVVSVCEEDMNKKKDDFNESRKDRKIIDKLKENAWQEYNADIEKREQKMNDEFALYRYVRR